MTNVKSFDMTELFNKMHDHLLRCQTRVMYHTEEPDDLPKAVEMYHTINNFLMMKGEPTENEVEYVEKLNNHAKKVFGSAKWVMTLATTVPSSY